jgi:phosphatidylglycerol:prolipoprotein diacylglycerol transferase
MTAYLAYPAWLSPTLAPVLPIRWYTLLHLLAYLLVYLLFLRHLRRRPPDVSELSTEVESALARRFFFWFIIGYLAGARFFGVLLFLPTAETAAAPWIVLWPFDAEMNFVGVRGMSFTGGLVGGAVSLLLFHWAKRVRLLRWADALALGLPLMFLLVRLGNFANQELYGRITEMPWAVLFPEARPVPLSQPGIRALAVSMGIEAIADTGFVNLPRHPVQLYEAIVTGLGLTVAVRAALLFAPGRADQAPPGRAAVVFVIGFGALQFLFGYLRFPPIPDPVALRLAPADAPTEGLAGLLTRFLSLTGDQLLSLSLLLAGVVLALALRRYRRRRPVVETFASD